MTQFHRKIQDSQNLKNTAVVGSFIEPNNSRLHMIEIDQDPIYIGLRLKILQRENLELYFKT